MSHVAVGVDIGGTMIKAAIVNEEGQILESRSAETPGTLKEFQSAIEAMITELTAIHPDVCGVGIGSKGIIDPSTTRVDVLPGTLHYLEGQNLAGLVRPSLPQQVPVAADNDARVTLVGEMTWGVARGCHDVIMLTLGTGVGGGIVVDGRIVRGSTGVAGHIGHYTINPDGPPCICGNRGCLETYFSARAIESEAFAAVHRGVATSLLCLERQPPSCADVFAAALGGDEIATGIIDRATAILSAAIAGLVLTLDPEFVIIGGQISAAGERFFEAIRKDVAVRTRLLLRRDVRVVPAALQNPSGVTGAAALVLFPAQYD
jgi:glucokinase